MPSFLSKIIKIVAVFVGGCITLICLIALPFAIDAMHNEIRLMLLRERVKKYTHPLDSQLLQRISLSGNFARASNQCGFIVAEARVTALSPHNIRKFYASILADPSYDKGPPYHEVHLYRLTDKEDVENIKLTYPDMYEHMLHSATTDAHSYLLLTAETGYPPNYDLRCH